MKYTLRHEKTPKIRVVAIQSDKGCAFTRASSVANGKGVSKSSALFNDDASDSTTVVSDGKVATAEADAGAAAAPQQQTTIGIAFKEGAKADVRVEYFDETTGQWVTVATKSDGQGNRTITVQCNVTPDKIRIHNLRDGGTYYGDGTHARPTYTSGTTSIGFEDKKGDTSFDDVVVTTTAQSAEPDLPAAGSSGTPPFHVQHPDGTVYDLNDPARRQAYLAKFDKDGNGYLDAGELAEALGTTPEHAQLIVRMYGTSDSGRTNVGIAVNDTTPGNGLGVDDMISDGALFQYTDQ